MQITPQSCRSLRDELGWTPEVLARRAGLTLRTVLDFEAGRRAPRPGTIIAIGNALDRAGADVRSAAVDAG